MRDSIASIIGSIPHRIALAGGWIDQPFISALNPDPPGSMVVVGLEPDRWFMDRCGIASGTREVALELWGGGVPDRPPAELVRELYRAENQHKAEPSGSQDMIGLLCPGVSRLDYDVAWEGGWGRPAGAAMRPFSRTSNPDIPGRCTRDAVGAI